MCHCRRCRCTRVHQLRLLKKLNPCVHVYFVRSDDIFLDPMTMMLIGKSRFCGRDTLHNAELQSATRVRITKIDLVKQSVM